MSTIMCLIWRFVAGQVSAPVGARETGLVKRASAICALSIGVACAPSPNPAPRTTPPPTRTVETVDVYHGTTIPDPYRWLEDLESEETRDWVTEQNGALAMHLAGDGRRGRILERMRDMLGRLEEFTRELRPVRVAGREFRTDEHRLWVRSGSDAAWRALVDVRRASRHAVLTGFQVAPDGRHVAYAISDGGSDWAELRIVDVDTGRDLPEVLQGLIFASYAWTGDGRGVLYARYERPEPRERVVMRDPAVYHHRLGDTQQKDRRVLSTPSGTSDVVMTVEVSRDGRHAFIYEGSGSHQGALGWARTRVHHLALGDVDASDAPLRPVALNATADAAYRVVASTDRSAYVFTSHGAPRHRLVEVDLQDPAPPRWRDVIPEAEGVLQSVHHVGGRFVAAYLENVHSALRIHSERGDLLSSIELPTLGSVFDIEGSPVEPVVTFTFSSYAHPDAVLRHDLATGATTLVRRLSNGFDPAGYETHQLWFRSRDGTAVPMFVTHRRGLALDGSHATILYGYGSSGTPLLPEFTEEVAAWLELGGVYAVANVRGGGEFGQAWYEAATLDRKQTSFDDFIAAAEHLIARGYTARERLAIRGGSFGGLLVGAVMTQRPELFAVALPEVPVVDLLRWQPGRHAAQYGSPTDSTQFATLAAYSPLHRIERGVCYPATLVSTALNDDRAPAWHAMKFTAALQAAQGCARPIFVRIEELGGHAGSLGREGLAEHIADAWSFAARHTGLHPGKP